MNTERPDLVESPGEIQKRQYLDLVWNMSKEQMFQELMRVHAESTKMMMMAQAELDELRATLAKLDKSLH
jgi:hypothetical protein